MTTSPSKMKQLRIHLKRVDQASLDLDTENRNSKAIPVKSKVADPYPSVGSSSSKYQAETETVINNSKFADHKLCGDVAVHSDSSKKHECSLCPKKFRTKCGLREHIQIHTREKTHLCNSCGKGFQKMSKLRQHERIHDTQRPRKFECEQCTKTFQENYLLKIHMVTHSGTKEFKCPQCPRFFLTKARVKSHLLTHTKEKPYKCSKCKKEIANSSNLKTHEKIAHTIACFQCDLRFVNRYDLNYHMQEHGEEICKFCDSFYPANQIKEHLLGHDGLLSFQCNVCFKTFSTKNSMKLHRVKHTEKHCCEICKKCFANTCQLSNHKSTHMAENNFPCKTYDKKFKTDNNLRIHTNKWHTEPAIFTCSACSETFRLEIEANEHAIKASSDSEVHVIKIKYVPAKPFKCEYCDVGFSAKSDLDRHILTHTKIKDHICHFCNKPFACRKGLFAHLRSHTEEKPFKCDALNCGLQLSSAASLAGHKETHSTNRKLHNCPVCDKQYLWTSLKTHMQNHKTTQLYSCEHEKCTKSFKHSADLKRHVRGVHVGEKTQTCLFCEKSFFSKSHLNRHMKCHTGEGLNIHVCEYCHKGFSEKYVMVQHIRRAHAREKKQVCVFCDKSFFCKTSLMTHAKIHTGEKPEKCEFCDKRCNSKSNLEVHIKRMHTGKKEFKCKHCDKSYNTKCDLVGHNRSHMR